MQNERKILVSAILKAEKNGYSNIILSNVLNNTDLDSRNKSFVTAAFYGVLERKLTLDYILNKYLKRPVKKLSPYTVAVLRTGTYQILFMEKIPASAAVNESVKLIKKSKENGNTGLVNAVLRKIATNKKSEELNEFPPYVKYSVDNSIYDRLIEDYGRQKAEAFLENSLCVPPVFVKLNTVLAKEEQIIVAAEKCGITLKKTELDGCFVAVGGTNIENSAVFKAGLIYVQDYSSAFCAAAVKAKPNMNILDCCAAPGGKSFSIAQDMMGKGKIISCDFYSHRVGLIEKGAERLGLECINPRVMNALEFDENLGVFDRVLCDVPCSGIGVIRRKPEIKYKKTEELDNLPALQFEILNNAKRYVKSGGRLIYSTCTVFKAENECVVKKFLAENKDFYPVPVDILDIEDENCTLIPPEKTGDGFFVAVMERK